MRSAPKVLLPGEGWPVRVNGSLRQKSVLPDMDNEMSQQTKQQVLAKWRRQYSKAGLGFKTQLLNQAVALLGYHRKAAIGALRARPKAPRSAAVVLALLPQRRTDPRAAVGFATVHKDGLDLSGQPGVLLSAQSLGLALVSVKPGAGH